MGLSFLGVNPPQKCSGILLSSLPRQSLFLLVLVSQSLLLSTFSIFTLPCVFSSHFFTSCYLIPTSCHLCIFVICIILIFTCCNFISCFRQSNRTHVLRLQEHCSKSIWRLKDKCTVVSFRQHFLQKTEIIMYFPF